MTFRKPYYNRYSQVGNDVFGYKTGAQNSERKTGREKGWKFVRFVPNTAPQISEMNELQDILLDAIKDIGDQILSNGQTRGLTLTLDLVNKKVKLDWLDPTIPAKVYVNGRLYTVPKVNLDITGVGVEFVSVEIIETIITEVEDPDLYNYTVGVDTEGGAGAYRVVYTVRPFIKNPSNANLFSNTYDIYQLQDGQIRSMSSEQLNNVDANLVRYTSNISGDCITKGMTVRAENASDTMLRIVVDRGTAYVSGREVGYKTSTPLLVQKAKFDTSVVSGEIKYSEVNASGSGLKTTITPSFFPISKVNRLKFYTAVERTGDFRQYPFNQNPLDPTEVFINQSFPFGPLVQVVAVYNSVTNQRLDFVKTDLGFRFTTGLPANAVRVVWVYNATLSLNSDFSISADKKSITLNNQYPASLNDGVAINTSVDRAQYVYPGIGNTRLLDDTTPNTAVLKAGTTSVTNLSIVSIDTTIVTSGDYSLKVEAGTNANTYKITFNETVLDNQSWQSGQQLTLSDPEAGGLKVQMGATAPTGLPQIDTITVTQGTYVVPLASYAGLVLSQQLKFMAGSLPSTNDQVVTINEFVKGPDGVTITGVRLSAVTASAYANGILVYTDPEFIQTSSSGGLQLSSDLKPIEIDYEWLFDRIDLVYIDADNNIQVQSGQSGKPALAPIPPLNVLPIAKIQIPANGNAADVVITEYPVRALTQQELRGLKLSLDEINYNAAIQNLKLDTYNKSAATGMSLRGILTDAFVNSDTLDINASPSVFSNISIDPENGILSPQLGMETFDLTPNAAQSTCYLGSRGASLGFTTRDSNLVINLRYTKDALDTLDVEVPETILNPSKPYLNVVTGDYIGTASGEAFFSFLNTQTRINESVPTSIEGGFWRSRSTEQSIPWLANRKLYLPATTLSLSGQNFAPGVYTVTADGQPITNAAGNEVTITVDASGSFLNQPVAVLDKTISATGVSTISLVDANDNIIASTLFGVTPLATAGLPVVHDCLAATGSRRYVQVGQTFTFPQDRFICGVNLYLASKSANGWFEVQIRNTLSNGEPGDEVFVRKRLFSSDAVVRVNSSADTANATRILFDDIVFCAANTSYTLVIEASDKDWSFRKAVMKNRDITANLSELSTPPLLNGMLYSSKDGATWVIQASSALTFSLTECVFVAGSNKLTFAPVAPGNNEKLNLIISRVHQLIPRNTSIKWSYSLDGNQTEIPLMVDGDGSMDPMALSYEATNIILTARFVGTTTVSPMLGRSNPKLLSFKPTVKGIYTTRTATSVPAYNSARVTFILSALSGASSVKVKVSTVPNSTGKAAFTLSGTPAFGDFITTVVDGVSYKFTYQAQAGSASLDDFAARLQTALVSNFPAYIVSNTKAGSTYRFSVVRTSGSAFIAGDVTAQIVTGGTSSLAVSSVSVDYVVVPQSAGVTIIDATYVEYTYAITGLSPTVGSDSLYTFRVQLELSTLTPQLYPKVKSFAVVVSN